MKTMETKIAALIRYGTNIDGDERCSVSKNNVVIHLTNAEIDRIIAARNEYHRETKHRGYPVRG